MSDDIQGRQDALDAELRAARDTLATLRAPAELEAGLRVAWRDRAARRAAVERRPLAGNDGTPALAIARGGRRFARPWRIAAAMLAASLSAAALLTPVLRPSAPRESSTPQFAEPTAARPSARGNDAPASRPFQPVTYFGGPPLAQSYLILRTRIPVGALGIEADIDADGMIGADVLIGEDGMIAGIRLDEPKPR